MLKIYSTNIETNKIEEIKRNQKRKLDKFSKPIGKRNKKGM